MSFLNSPTPLAIAHRGGSLEAPENTLVAFQNAIDLGYKYLETDVWCTADGVLVVFHDKDVKRLTGKKGKIANLTWAEVSQLRVSGHPILKAEELFGMWDDVCFNIDPKHGAVVAPLAQLIEDMNLVERVCIGSFFGHRQKSLRKILSGRVVISSGVLGVLRVLVGSILSKLLPKRSKPPRKLHNFQCLQIPPNHWGIELISNAFVAQAHKMGLAIHVWTVNEQDEMERLLDMGVDGIMTDSPSALKKVLIHRKMWKSMN